MKVPLAFVPESEEVVVVEVLGGRGLTRRLHDLGLIPGTKVRVLKSCSPGPLLIDVRGSRIALGRGITMKIMVDLGDGYD